VNSINSRISQLTDDQRAALLHKLKEAAGEVEPQEVIAAVPRDGRAVTLSSTQERIWFQDQFAPGHAIHNMSGVARVPVAIDPEAFGRALAEVAGRHEILRMSFGLAEGSPVGLIADQVTVPVRVVEQADEAARDEEFLQDARTPFDLRTAPLLRVTVAPLGPQECLIQLTMHHLISDGFSTGALMREVGELYRNQLTWVRPALEPLPFQFADYAHWEREQSATPDADARLDYWKQQLAGAPQLLALPSDLPRPARMTYRGERAPVRLPDGLAERIRARSAEHGVTPFVTMLAAYAVVLQRYTLQDDIVVGVPVANRDNKGTEALIGPFLNTIAVRCDLEGNPDFGILVKQLHQTSLDGFANQEVSFEKVLQAAGATRDPSRSALFQTVFNFQSDWLAGAGTTGIELRDVHNGTCQFDLLLNLVDSDAGVSGHLDYYADVFSAEWVDRFISSYLTVLETFAADWSRPIGHVPLLPAAEAAALVDQARGSRTPYDNTKCVHDLVLDQARREPDRTALVAEAGPVTYRELEQRTAALAARLRAAVGDKPEAHIGICLQRSADMVVALVAILRAGYSYISLDPSYPAERLAFALSDGGIAGLVAQQATVGSVPEFDGPTLLLDSAETPDQGADQGAATLPEPAATPDGRTYTIYTSGSTGTPKGVQVSHRNVVNFLGSMADEPGLGPDDVLLAVTSLSFDIAVLELLLPLSVGAAVVIATTADVVDGRRLAALLDQHHVTVMQATPTTWQLLIDSGWSGRPGLRVLCGGEAMPPALAEALLPRCGELWNMYGPTETTVWSTVHQVTAEDLRALSIPIGHPIRNTSVYVLDNALNPMPPGVPGELCLGGDGVTLGYLGRPTLTAARFVRPPFDPDDLLYRTGDLAVRRADGTFEYSGRLDHQVKLRGFRIELGEIEAVLEQYSDVARCITVAHEDSSGGKELVAYVEQSRNEDSGGPAETQGESLSSRLRDWLRGRLPEYMVPSKFMVLDAFPQTPNGKIDRNALPDPVGDDAAAERPAVKHVAPGSELENRLVEIWEDLLGTSPVGVQDNFFDIGGHSLLATKLVFRVREVLGADLPLRVLFEDVPTIARMAELIKAGPADGAGAGQNGLDLQAEVQLDPAIRPDPGYPVNSVRDPQHPLLTGATGFVGAFLLAELLDRTDATVFCLVRGATEADGLGRIRKTMDGYGIWDPAYEARIIPMLGDLSRPALGLSRAQRHHLVTMVDVIYHCGAEVNFLRPYRALKASNVTGTQEVLRLACEGAAKPVHFVSSVYAFSRFAYPPGAELTEDMVPRHDLVHTFGYTQTKWVSERIVVEAGNRGLPVYLFRPGRVAGHSRTGACQANDLVWQATKVGIELGAAPLMDMDIDSTPVDFVVQALVHLSRQSDLAGQAFHLISNEPMREEELVDWMAGFGFDGERLPFAEWSRRVMARAADLDDTAAGALAPFMSTLPLDQLPEARFDTSNVDRGLQGTDIVCPPPDDRLMRLYFDYFIGTGYLPAPQTQDYGSTTTREVFA
jgi:myxalamid-type nonribosomal peptide synthetase MxaA